MADITAAKVNELRARTGQGMMDCKKVLVEAEGDLDRAIDIFRKRGVVVPTAVLLGVLSAQGAHAAPVGLASSVIASAPAPSCRPLIWRSTILT